MPVLTFKTSPEEARRIRALARRDRTTVSEFLRRRALGDQGTLGSVRMVRCPHTGAMIFAPDEGSPALTTETVREMLSGFP